MTNIDSQSRLHQTTQSLRDLRPSKTTHSSTYSIDRLRLNHEKEPAGCLIHCWTWVRDFLLSLFWRHRGDKNISEHHAFALQFMKDFRSVVALLDSKEALERFEKADSRAQD